MVDKSLAGYNTVDTWTPDQLYAGEADIVTTQHTIAHGTAAMVKYQVVAEVAGKLIPYDKENGVSGANVPMGVLPHAVDASGASVDIDTPVIIGGVLNFDALVADSQTYDLLKAAFRLNNSNIIIQKLY